MVNDMLDLSKIQSGDIELATEPVNLKGLIAEITGQFASRIGFKET